MLRSHWPPRLIATGAIAADSTIERAEGIENVTNPNPGEYQLELTYTYPENTQLFAVITPDGNTPMAWTVAEEVAPSNLITIFFVEGGASAANTPFTLRIYKDA